MRIGHLDAANKRALASLIENQPDKYGSDNRRILEVMKDIENLLNLAKVPFSSSQKQYPEVEKTLSWNRIVSLRLHNFQIPLFPESIFSLKSLTTLDISANQLE